MLTTQWPIELRRFGRLIDLPARATVFEEGVEASGVFLLLAGAVKITRRCAAEGEEVLLMLVWPGTPFGDEGLVPGRKWLDSALTLSRSRLLHLDRDGLAQAFQQSPAVALDLMERMARRQGAVHERILELSWTDPGDRIDSALERLADLTAGRGDGGFDECDVAAHALVSRNEVRTYLASGAAEARL